VSSFKMTGVTDPGRMRAENEDNIATFPALGLAVLADGMGGHQAGEVASRMAVDVISRHFQEVFTRHPTGSGNGKSLEQRTKWRINAPSARGWDRPSWSLCFMKTRFASVMSETHGSIGCAVASLSN
jgi:hypothetical protein